MTEYSAIILAGGKSSRMGQKKSTLLFQGKTFIGIIIDKLKELGIRDILISGFEYINIQGFEYINDDDSVTYVEDIYPDKGPLAGVHAGLCRAVNDSVLVLTEDAPLVPETFLRQLMEEHERGISQITVTSFKDRLQQFPGTYEKKLIPLCEKILQEEKSTVMKLIEETGCSKVPFHGDEIILRGCNTPEEYQKMTHK